MQKNASITELKERASQISAFAEQLTNIQTVLARLQAAGEARRLGRAPGMQIKNFQTEIKGGWVTRVNAEVVGDTSVYYPRITFLPRAGHFCTCLDWQQRGLSVGPCKHVLRLGALYQTAVTDTFNMMDTRIKQLLDAATTSLTLD
jgi:hypothetical protein